MAAKDNDIPTSANRCIPIYCGDGQQFPSCAKNGAPINYFVEPCLNHGGQVLAHPTVTPTPKVQLAWACRPANSYDLVTCFVDQQTCIAGCGQGGKCFQSDSCAPTLTPSPVKIGEFGIQLKDKLKDIFTRPKITASPTVTPTPKPRKTEITACKDAFNTAKKVYANAKEKARNEYLASLKKATNDYKAAYKLARENKSNEAKKAARDAHDALRKAAQQKYAADKEAMKNAYEAAVKVYNQCVRKPTPTPKVSPTPSPSQ